MAEPNCVIQSLLCQDSAGRSCPACSVNCTTTLVGLISDQVLVVVASNRSQAYAQPAELHPESNKDVTQLIKTKVYSIAVGNLSGVLCENHPANLASSNMGECPSICCDAVIRSHSIWGLGHSKPPNLQQAQLIIHMQPCMAHRKLCADQQCERHNTTSPANRQLCSWLAINHRMAGSIQCGLRARLATLPDMAGRPCQLTLQTRSPMPVSHPCTTLRTLPAGGWGLGHSGLAHSDGQLALAGHMHSGGGGHARPAHDARGLSRLGHSSSRHGSGLGRRARLTNRCWGGLACRTMNEMGKRGM